MLILSWEADRFDAIRNSAIFTCLSLTVWHPTFTILRGAERTNHEVSSKADSRLFCSRKIPPFPIWGAVSDEAESIGLRGEQSRNIPRSAIRSGLIPVLIAKSRFRP
jgi:hypothetical protein